MRLLISTLGKSVLNITSQKLFGNRKQHQLYKWQWWLQWTKFQNVECFFYTFVLQQYKTFINIFLNLQSNYTGSRRILRSIYTKPSLRSLDLKLYEQVSMLKKNLGCFVFDCPSSFALIINNGNILAQYMLDRKKATYFMSWILQCTTKLFDNCI